MGVDSNLLINSKYNAKDVVKLLKALGIKDIKEDHKGDHSFLTFELEGSYTRQLYVAQSSEYGGVTGTILSYRSNDEGIALLKKIAKVLGGFLQEQDCDEQWESFHSPHAGSAEFVLKHTILTKAIVDGSDLSDKVANAIGYK